MEAFPHLATLYVAAALSAAVAAALLLTQRLELIEMRGRIWIACLASTSLAFAAYAARGVGPDWVPIVVGNSMAWLAFTSAWHGSRQLRAAPSWKAWIPVPSLLWIALCMNSEFYYSDPARIVTAGGLGILLAVGVTIDIWISWHRTRLSSLRHMAVLFSLYGPNFLMRIVFLQMGVPSATLGLGAAMAFVSATAIPFMVLAVTRERTVQMQRQRDMDKLLQSRAEIDRLLNGLPAVVFLRELLPDGSTRLVYRGGDAERVIGWPSSVLDGLDDLSVLAVNLTDRERDAAYHKAMSGNVSSLEFEIKQPGGGTRWVRAIGRGLGQQSNGATLAVGHIVDIQEQRTAEARAASAARLASLGEMALGLAHELRQPLAIVSMAAENVLDDIKTGSLLAAEARLHRIIRQNQRASDIIDNLRRFATAQHAGAAEPVALREAVEHALLLAGGSLHAAGVEVEQDIPSPSPVALAWPGAIEQMLMNLLSNANDAMAARQAGTRHVRIIATADHAAGTVRLAVSDTGGGVPPHILPRLFQPFVTTKTQDRGTGLGLAICHGMAKALGGGIAAMNQGEGATFTIILPAAPPPAPDAARSAV